MPGKAPSLTVYDAAAKKYMFMPNSGVVVSGKSISMTVPGELAPLDGPRPLALQVRLLALLAQGRPHRLGELRQLRPRDP